MTYANGDLYQGEWKNDLPNGNGCFVNNATGTISDGEWVDNMMHGDGIQSIDHGRVTYTGSFYKGL